MVTSHIQYLVMAVISGSWKAFDIFCGQITANSLICEKLEVLVTYSNFQMDPFGDDSLSTNVLSVSSAYFCLFLLIDRTKGHKLFNDHLLHLRAELPVQRWQKKFIYFLPFPASPELESHGKKVEMCSALFLLQVLWLVISWILETEAFLPFTQFS